MRMIRLVLFLLLSFSILITGCNNSNGNGIYHQEASTVQTTDIKIYTESDLTNLIDKKVKDNHMIKEKVRITEILHDEKSTFVKFIFEENKTLFEGIAYAEQIQEEGWRLEHFNVLEVDKEPPFTHHEYVAGLNDGTARDFKIISGYINELNITEIRIEYRNSEMKVIKIGENQKTYMDYVIGDIGSIKEIIGLDEKGIVIYKY
ncbi:hypothetical protein [Brevibacillus invocatus]|uniref:hypothetical protein n=1 Tax=Brevibacillus invocatus TaxID=173959 RepID=UPI00203C9E36|nr:hypothetical protein [Brevibacillus invocatus]MCM3079116.1 hypothetical protein [Brevibacillus invocatus]MCM3429823.1 hypothetical protein [Brevibacillus invocatus]